MYQKAGQMFYDAYTINPANKDAVYKWYLFSFIMLETIKLITI